jgi:tetratricopeptide (TPR) repeat protein
LGLVGDSLYNSYHQGHIDVIRQLVAEEANLLHARRLARTYGWWDQIIGPMQGLRILYQHTARTAEWARLVDELVPDLVDPANDGPRPGREQQWRPLTEYRARLALETRDFSAAERLQQALVEDARTRAASALATALEALTKEQRFLQIRSLAVAIEGLGHIQREQGQPGCVASYQEALELYQRIGDRQGQAIVANNLAQSYIHVPALRNLEAAKTWAQQSLNLFNKNDSLSRSKCFHLLAGIAYERFQDAREAGAPGAELLGYLRAARQAAHQALDLTPPEAIRNLANRHGLLGGIYSEYADRRALQAGMDHLQEALRIYEATGDRYEAAGVRFNVAVALSRDAGRLDEARLWAQAALRDFESFGHVAEDRAEQARRFLNGIEADIEQRAKGE